MIREDVNLSDENLNRLTHLIYETLEDYSVWEKFFNSLCKSVGAYALHLVAHDKSNGALSYSAGFNMIAQGELDYLHKYQFIDPRVPALLPKPVMEWIHDHEFISEQAMATHPFYQEFMIPYGVKYLSATKLLENEQALILFGAISSPEQGPLPKECVAFLNQLLPHISRVCRLTIQNFTYSTQALVGNALVNKLRQPVILITLNGEVIHVNESAQQLLNATNLISVKNNQLILPSKHGKAFFDECIAMEYAMRADSNANNTSKFKLLQITSGEYNNTLYAYYSLLLPQRLQGAFGLRPLVMLLFYHPESAPKIDSTILTAAFGLTPSECRTAILLAEGFSQKDISKKLDIQHDTVRKQLQNIYQKTSTHQQSDLIKLMLHLPSNFIEES